MSLRQVQLLEWIALRDAGWCVGVDRVQRIWRRERLKVPKKQRPRGRLWLNDGSCVRLRPERRHRVWSYDFAQAQTYDGRKVRLMTLIDEFAREYTLPLSADWAGTLRGDYYWQDYSWARVFNDNP